MAIDVDDVEARPLRPQGSFAMPTPEVPDVGAVHRARLHRIVASIDRDVRNRDRHLPAVEAGIPVARVRQFDPRQCAVQMNALVHPGEDRDVPVVPQSPLDQRRHVTRGVNVRLFRADDRPSTLGLDAAHGNHRAGKAHTHAVAMGHLEEPVLGRDRAHSDGLEQNVVPWIARHPQVSQFRADYPLPTWGRMGDQPAIPRTRLVRGKCLEIGSLRRTDRRTLPGQVIPDDRQLDPGSGRQA